MKLGIVRAGILQRLYSTFANGWPGAGLLLMRLAAAAFLLAQCRDDDPPTDASWAMALAAAGGLLLLAGLWTPIAASLITVYELWIAICAGDNGGAPLLAAALTASLALLGPGYWSVDARLFGRRRIPW